MLQTILWVLAAFTFKILCLLTERRNWNLHGVNENFKHRPNTNGSDAADLEQVQRKHRCLEKLYANIWEKKL
jgi:hypothetical protein